MPSRTISSLLCLVLVFSLFVLPYLVQPQTAIDDSFITARHSRNLARGEGLLFNPGEQVLGTTTPLWALGIVWIFQMPLSAETQGYLVSLLAGILALTGIWLWSRYWFSESLDQSRLLASALILIPSTADAFVMGMETGPLILFCSLFWIMLANDKPNKSKWYLIVALAQLILLLRLDSVFFLGSFGLAYLILSGPKNRRSLVFCGLSVSILTLGWLYFCKVTYGHYFPHSMLAKSSFSKEFNFGLVELSTNWIEKTSELLRLNFPWPVKFKSVCRLIYDLAVCGAFLLSMMQWHKLRKNQQIALLGTGFYLFSYALFFSLGRAGIFPWYAHLPCFVFFGVTIPILIENKKSFGCNLVLGGVLAGSVFMQVIGVTGFLKLKDQNSPGLFLGNYLKNADCKSVMLEPIGYIGFFSDCRRVYDLAGLVSPEVLDFRRTGLPGWFFKSVQEFKPQYIVLRNGEVENNLGFNVGILFSDETERKEFVREYKKVTALDQGWSNTYSLYQRTE